MNIKQTLITLSSALGAIAIVTTITFALPSSTLEPQGEPGENTQYTLNDIHTRLTTNDPATEGSGLFTTPTIPGSSFYTLKDIYDAIPTIDPTKVALGTSYLGVDGELIVGSPELEWSTTQGPMIWDTAVSTCAGTVDGSTGWRLPTIQEYQSITDFTLSNNATVVEGFAQLAGYWSSTPYAGNPVNAWYWRTYDGIVNFSNKTNQYSVRCVR